MRDLLIQDSSLTKSNMVTMRVTTKNESERRDELMGKLYFAYGSNLNLTQMANRCPQAKQLGSAYLPNWRLVFRGVADIEPSRNSDDLLPIGVWEITNECESSLDIYEGFPHLYRKIKVNGMMTYTMNKKDVMPPSSSYFNSILEGYKDFGLDNSHLYEALGWSHYTSKQYEWSLPKKKFKPLFINKS